MGVSSRTAVAVHALTYLARWEGQGLQPSAKIAESLGSNPALVRRILGLLRDKGLVSPVEGSGGGWCLARPAEEISLADAYEAAEGGAALLPAHAHPPNQACVIGRHMQSVLEDEFAAAQRALEDHLAQTSIAEMVRQVLAAEREMVR